MSYTKLKDARSTFSLDSLRLNIKNKQNIAPQKGAVELYIRDNTLYMMLDDGTEYIIGGILSQGGVTSGIPLTVNRVLVNVDYSISAVDNYVGATAGGLILTLPKASLVTNGHTLVIKNEGNFTNTVKVTTGDFLDANTSTTLLAYESLTLVCNGADKWFLI